MASVVKTDTITGLASATTLTLPTTTKIGATAIVSASAGSATIIAEGGTVVTNIQQGLAKGWINFEGDGTIAISDSFNVSGITDNTTGDYKIAIDNNMGNANYSVTGSGTHDAGSNTCYLAIDHDVPPTTSTVDVNAMQGSNDTRIDAELLCATIHGDLA